MTELTQLQLQFIEDYALNPHNGDYLASKYGKDNVSNWVANQDIASAMAKRKVEVEMFRAEQEELLTTNWGQLKNISYELIKKVIKNPDHPEAVKTARWILNAEYAYMTKRAEQLGIKSGGMVDSKREPLKIILDTDSEDDKETS